MEDSRTASIVLLIVAVILAVGLFANFVLNINPKYKYLTDAKELLRDARANSFLEGKIELVNRSLIIYQTGLSQKHLQIYKTLLSASSIQEIDYWLPKAIDYIDQEQNDILVPLHGILLTMLVLAFLGTTSVGTFGDYTSWTINEKHFYMATIYALLLAIIVAFIP